MTVDIRRGDCRDLLPALASDSVDSIVTDPPYEIGFMSAEWDKTGITFSTPMWRECLRVLKPGGHLLAFSAPRKYHRLAVSVEAAGFEIVDQVLWIYAQGMPKSGNLKPAHEPILLARKPFKGSRAKNVATHGTGALNVDACRIEGRERTEYGLKNATRTAKGVYGVPSSSADFDSSKGRYPANLIHDGSPEVVALFPNNNAGCKPHRVKASAASVAALNKKGWGFSGSDKITGYDDGDDLSAARFFYAAKASQKERHAGLPLGGNHHTTVKPVELMRYLCRLVTPPGGLVLDPFAGSGTTGVAAILEGRHAILIERDTDDDGNTLGYVDIAEGRCANALFGDLL